MDTQRTIIQHGVRYSWIIILLFACTLSAQTWAPGVMMKSRFDTLVYKSYLDVDTAELFAHVPDYCIDSVVIPLGSYQMQTMIVPGTTYTCDTTCMVIEERIYDVHILTPALRADLEAFALLADGIGSWHPCRPYQDIHGDMTICYEVDPAGGTHVSMHQLKPGAPRPCPQPWNNVRCVTRGVYLAWYATRVGMGMLPAMMQIIEPDTTTFLNCYSWAGTPNGTMIYPGAYFYRIIDNCRLDSIQVHQQMWVSAGRDSIVYYNKCVNPCIRVGVTATAGGFRTDTILIPKMGSVTYIDTVWDATWYRVPTSVTSEYVDVGAVFPPSSIDSMIAMLNLPIDTITGWRGTYQWLPWRAGHRPFVWKLLQTLHGVGCSMIGYGTHVTRKATYILHRDYMPTQQTWTLMNNANPFRTYAAAGTGYCPNRLTNFDDQVYYYAWIPDATLDSLHVRYPPYCDLQWVDYRWQYGPPVSVDSVFIYSCVGTNYTPPRNAVDSIWYKYPNFSSPIPYRIDTLALYEPTGEYEPMYIQTYDPDMTTYNVLIEDTCRCNPELIASGIGKELCGPFEIINECEGGYQPRWIDDNTLAIYATCLDPWIIPDIHRSLRELSWAITRIQLNDCCDSVRILNKRVRDLESKLEPKLDNNTGDFALQPGTTHFIDAGGGNIHIHPPSDVAEGDMVAIKRTDGGGHDVIFNIDIDGDPNNMLGPGESIKLMWYNGEWRVIEWYKPGV